MEAKENHLAAATALAALFRGEEDGEGIPSDEALVGGLILADALHSLRLVRRAIGGG